MSQPVDHIWKPVLTELTTAARVAPNEAIGTHAITWLGMHEIPEVANDFLWQLISPWPALLDWSTVERLR